MSGETTVGSIVGFLRLNITDFEAGIAKARGLADNLDRKDIDIRVKVETAGAETKLAAVSAEANKADHSVKNLGNSSKDMSKHAQFLVAALLTVGPALVPLAAAAAGLATGFGAMGVSGVLAVVGIRKEMATGTAIGQKYTDEIATLKGNLVTLGQTAAAGVLQPFQQAVADLQQRMPALNTVISNFSALTGRTAGALMAGLVAAFIALAPLARDAGMYIYNLSQRFAAMMSGPGVVSFGDYVRSVFPHVMEQVENIVGAVIRLVAAFAPFGTGILTLIGAFAGAINSIPVDVLSKIATGGLAIFLGFKTFALLSLPIDELGGAMRSLGASEAVAAAGMRAMTMAAGAIGAVIAVATILYTAHEESVRGNVQAANDYADALRTSNGVIDENIRQMTVKNLSDSGALAAARQLGLNLSLVTDAALGNAGALTTVTAVAKPFHDALILSEQGAGASSAAITANGHAADTLTSALGGTNTALKSGQQTYKDQAAATAVSTVATTAESVAQQNLAAALGVTVPVLLATQGAQQKTADAAAAATAKMQLENDAAGLLRGTLDLLNGKAISAADAQNAFDSSLSNMGTHVNATGKQITFTTASIRDMSSASVALRGQLNGQISNLQRVVEANGGFANSTGAARAQMVKMRQQIIDNAVAHGVDRAAVTAYIDSILKIPKTVPPTKLDVDSAAALEKIRYLKAQIDGVHGKAVQLIVQTVEAGYGPSGMTRKQAVGGPVTGPGTGTSDSIPVRLSNGEFVVNAAQTAKNGPLLHAINSGVAGFASGGFVVDTRPVSSTAGARSSSGRRGSSSARRGSSAAKQVWTINGKEYGSAIAAHNAGVAAAAKQAHALAAAAAKRAHVAAVAAAKQVAALAAAAKALATTQREYQYTYLPSFVGALGGTTSALVTAGRSLIAEVAKTASAHQMSTSMISKISIENAKLDELATSRDSIAAQLKDANTALTAAQTKFKDEQSAASASLGSFDITKSISAADMIHSLQEQIKTGKQFGDQIKTLSGEGLNATILKQLADAGPSAVANSPLAQMLAASPGQIGQINALMAQLQTSADTTGTSIATSLYGAGVDAAQGLVDGLTSKESSIVATMKTLADAMVAQIKKSLGIKSPSTVMRGLGQYTGAGFALGLKDSHAGTVLAAAGLAQASVPTVHMPSGSMDFASKSARASAVAGASGGGDLVTHMTVQVGEQVLFEAVRRESIAAARRNGSSGIKP